MTPAGTSNELDVQNEWEENTHTHTDQREWHRMTRMTRPDCAVMCNLINTHTHTHYCATKVYKYGASLAIQEVGLCSKLYQVQYVCPAYLTYDVFLFVHKRLL